MAINNDHVYTSKAKDVVLRTLQMAFSSPNLFSGRPNDYLYSEDEKASRLMIADYNTTNLNSINVKPAFLVARGQVYPQRIGLSDKNIQTFMAGYETRELIMNVNMAVNCYAREGLEAEMLATVVFRLFRYLNEQIQKMFEVYNIEVQGIGAEQPVVNELNMVPVSMVIAIPDTNVLKFNEIQLNRLIVRKDGQQEEFRTPVN